MSDTPSFGRTIQLFLVDDAPGGLVIASIHGWTGKSPSAAAAVVLDRNANGRTEWKVAGSKRTYHAWQEDNAKGEEITV